MITDLITRYQAALKEADFAWGAITLQAALLQAVGNQLATQPLQLTLDNAPVGFPATLMASQEALRVDLRLWPSGDDLARSVSALHAHLGEARRIYGEMPESLRRVVVKPPKG